jgi:hypothetical protein
MIPIKTLFRIPDIFNFKKFGKVIILIFLLIYLLVFIKSKSNTYIPTLQQFQTEIKWVGNNSSADIFYPNIGMIIEFRAVYHVIAIVHNVNHHIPSSWPIQIFHGKHNEQFIRESTLAPLIATGKVFLTLLNETFDRGGISHLLTNSSFWKRVRGEKILFFQIDSVMCSTSPHKVTDFLQYDYIGGPWDTSWYPYDKTYLVGNGGFSFRTRSKILALLAILKYDNSVPEDVWYAQNLRRVNGSIPPIEIAKTFSVESVYYDRPVGVHHFPWSCQFRMNLSKTCPDSMLIWEERC